MPKHGFFNKKDEADQSKGWSLTLSFFGAFGEAVKRLVSDDTAEVVSTVESVLLPVLGSIRVTEPFTFSDQESAEKTLKQGVEELPNLKYKLVSPEGDTFVAKRTANGELKIEQQYDFIDTPTDIFSDFSC